VLSWFGTAVLVQTTSDGQARTNEKNRDFMTRLKKALDTPAKSDDQRAANEQPGSIPGRPASQRDELMERIWCVDVPESATRELCWKSYQARMNYYIGAMEHRSRVFWWQHFASRIIFVVVIGLVSVGVYFAWVQFRKDLASRTGDAPASQIEVATTGLKVSSPVLGMIILVVSLAFFYLYLKFVFPITQTF
jgi:hypothetical protein